MSVRSLNLTIGIVQIISVYLTCALMIYLT